VGGRGRFNGRGLWSGWGLGGWLGRGLARRLWSCGGGCVGARGGIRLLPAPGSLAERQGFDLRTVELGWSLPRGGRSRESEGRLVADASGATERYVIQW